jgi:proteasome activator subunit 4
VATHSSPVYDPRLLSPLEQYNGGDDDLCGVGASSLAGLRENAKALLTQFVAGAAAAAKEALAANPAEKAAAASAAAAAAAAGGSSSSTAMEVDSTATATATATAGAGAGAAAASGSGSESFTAPAGRGQAWLEGVMMTVIQLAKHGDAAHVAGDIALLLPTVLRVQEPPDRDFALVAKRTLTYLKYIIFPREVLAVVVAGLLEGLRDAQWHARAASLKFLQAFAFRHAFLLTPDELASLRDEAGVGSPVQLLHPVVDT